MMRRNFSLPRISHISLFLEDFMTQTSYTKISNESIRFDFMGRNHNAFNEMSVYQHNVVNYRDFSTFIARELTFFFVSFEDAQSRERSGHLAVEEKEDKLFK